MNTLRSLLQDADPLRHETPRLDAERERIRLAILNSTTESPRRSRRARLTVASALALVMLSVVALGYRVWVGGTTTLLAAVRFEVRLAEVQPMPGLTVAQVTDSDQLIYLHPEAVVTNDDIAQSWTVQNGAGEFEVTVQFLPSGADRMRQATKGHLGRPVAILIDGSVAMAPIVRAPISESAVISGRYTQAEAQRIADGISKR